MWSDLFNFFFMREVKMDVESVLLFNRSIECFQANETVGREGSTTSVFHPQDDTRGTVLRFRGFRPKSIADLLK